MMVASIVETDIAVIGMSCRFPGAQNPAEFWANLLEGKESITFFSREELLAAGLDAAQFDHRAYVPARGVLDDIEKFDAVAFDMTPAEAAMTDPQHRLFMECAWEAMEDGGYDGSRFKGPIGVYGGCGANTYLRNHVLPAGREADLAGLYQMMQANQNDFLATKTAYKLNLTGPAITVQTACSTSLVAVHCACQAIINGECDMALAGGVSVFLPQICGYQYQEGMILSDDGHCRAFDASANGTVMGSGAGVVLLKRLEEALHDRDHIHGVIKGGAVNNDGAGKVGFTAPGVEGQLHVIREALAVSEVDPEAIGYVETHGTGTPMGDPVEIEALRRAFEQVGGRPADCCFIGSVKTNIGHCDAASGIAGLLKTVLIVKNGMVPPSLHYERPNPAINFAATPFRVCTQPSRWEEGAGLRIAGVSSFGMGGTNAHLIVQQAPVDKKALPKKGIHLLPISGKSAEAVDQSRKRLVGHMTAFAADDIADIAFTLQNGRRQFHHRIFCVCGSREEAIASLSDTYAPDLRYSSLDGKMSPAITFMFPGQGSQYPGMGRELYETEKVFRDTMDLCAETVQPLLGGDIRRFITSDDTSFSDELNQTAIAQPVLFCVEYSYAMLLTHWGIRPQAVIGHSLGEYVAACLAGIFTLPDALRLVVARGDLMQRQPKGKMVAVMQSEAEVELLVNGAISLAAVNGTSCTLSGADPAIQELIEICIARNIPHTVLKTSHAFHSALFDRAVDEFTAIVETIPRVVPAIPVISNLTGKPLSDREAVAPRYWARQLRHTVRFGDGLTTLLADPNRLLVEVGPGRMLSSMARRYRVLGDNQHVVTTGRHVLDEQGCARALFAGVGEMWSLGVTVDWQKLVEQGRNRRLPLPTYPFEREKHWIPADNERASAEEAAQTIARPEQWFYSPAWRQLPLAEQENTADGSEQWLLVGDTGPLFEEILRVLNGRGCIILTVKSFEFPVDTEHLRNVLATYSDAERVHIVYLPSLTPLPSSHILPEQTLRFTIALANVLEQHPPQQQILCDILSYGMYDITGEEKLVPANSALVSVAKSISQEYPACDCRCIDCGITDAGTLVTKAWAENLVNELMTSDRRQAIVLRGGHRWQEHYQAAPSIASGTAFRDAGTYLITGGLGDIGLAFADWISRQLHVNLVLTRRSPFPEQDCWDDWLLQKGENSTDSRIIHRLKNVRERGSVVMTASVDVSSPTKMRELFDQVTERFGKIDGCIHAAGVTGAGALGSYARMTVEKFYRILSPKYEGYCVLRELLRKSEPDFLIAMSSLAAILGGSGMGAYGGANAVMASQITADNREGGRWLCIDWDGWRFTEGRVNESPVHEHQAAAIPFTVGAEQLARLTQKKSTDRIAVSTTDLNARLRRRRQETGQPQREISADLKHIPHPSECILDNAEEEMVADIWRSVLGTPKINRHDSFFSLGGNSLQITQVHSRLKESLGIEFPLRSLFEAPRLMDMAELVRQYTVQPGDGCTPSREEMEF